MEIANCLVQLVPEYFTPAWKEKIISDTAGNWKLKVINLCVIILTLSLGSLVHQSEKDPPWCLGILRASAPYITGEVPYS